MSWEFEQQFSGSVSGDTTYKTCVGGSTRAHFWLDGPANKNYIAVYDFVDGIWTKTAIISDEIASELTFHQFAISADGTTIAVVYKVLTANPVNYQFRIYTRTGNTWDITASTTGINSDYVGYSDSLWFDLTNTTLYAKSIYKDSAYTIRKYTISNGNITYTSSYSYADDATHPYNPAITMLWGGRDVWAFSFNRDGFLSFSSFGYWSAEAEYEKLTYNYFIDNNSHSLPKFIGPRIESFQPAITNPNQLSATMWYNKIYLLVGNKIIRFDIDGLRSEGVIATVPETAQSNICAADGKLFVSGKELNSDESQKLHIFNLATDTWSSTILPGRHQVTYRHIVNGLDGYVWITNMNNHGIIKVNIATGGVASSVRINRHPYRLSVNQSKELYVASDFGGKVKRKDFNPDVASTTVSTSMGGQMTVSGSSYKVVETTDCTDGMVTLIDQVNDSQDNFAAARTNGEALLFNAATVDKDFYDDGQGHLWFVTDTNMGRLTKTDKELKCSHQDVDSSATSEPDYNMIPDNGTIDVDLGGTVIASVVTPPLHFQRYVGTAFEDRTVRPYLFVITSTGAVKAFRLSALVRKNKYILRGTSLIAVGAQAYVGD